MGENPSFTFLSDNKLSDEFHEFKEEISEIKTAYEEARQNAQVVEEEVVESESDLLSY
jgi:hypothetical protein